jgi:hypothetical protein
MAAVAAGRNGMKTALLCASWPSCFPEGGHLIGGMSSGGLGQTDYGGPTGQALIGGLALEFYTRNRAHYSVGVSAEISDSCRLPAVGCNQTFNLEPHVAESIFRAMLADANVSVVYSASVEAVQKAGTTIQSIALTGGQNISSKVFVDASYEGDLFARAGVSYVVGREAKAKYGESLAGMSAGARSNQFSLAVDPFELDGVTPLPLTTRPVPGAVVGGGDTHVQSYNFRLCATKVASNRAPWPKPDGYDPKTFELLRRYVTACTKTNGCQLGTPSCNVGTVPADKADVNNCGGIASDFIGGSYTYPDASYAARRAVWRQHLHYHQGLMWTLANDPLIPSAVRDEMAQWGLCKDEFANNTLAPNWPPALYVRAARRMQAGNGKVFTQNSPGQQRAAGGIGHLSVGLGGYNFDSHNAQRLACHNKSDCYGTGPRDAGDSTPFAWDEGDVQTGPGVYQIPLWTLLPQEEECSNLVVVAAPSARWVGGWVGGWMRGTHFAFTCTTAPPYCACVATPQAHFRDLTELGTRLTSMSVCAPTLPRCRVVRAAHAPHRHPVRSATSACPRFAWSRSS